MAYNQFFPTSYQQYQQPFAYQQYQQNYSQYQPGIPGQQIPSNGQSSQPQIQNGGFISVRSIEEAFNWPVAPGNSITFKDENAPYVYTKTKGFSQLEQPTFERYRLVKEEDAVQNTTQCTQSHENGTDYDEQIKLLWAELNALKTRVCASEPKENAKDPKKTDQKKEVKVDDAE